MQFHRMNTTGSLLTLSALGLMTALALTGCGGGGGGGGSNGGGGGTSGGGVSLPINIPPGATAPGGVPISGTATTASPSNSGGLNGNYQFIQNGTFTTTLPAGPYSQDVTVAVPYSGSAPAFVAVLKNNTWIVLNTTDPVETCFGAYNATRNGQGQITSYAQGGVFTVGIHNPAGISQIAVVSSPNGVVPAPPQCQ